MRPVCRIWHAYHCWLHGEAWKGILAEHIEALQGFDGPVTVGLMGDRAQRDRAVRMFDAAGQEAEFVVLAGEWEHDTLELVRQHAATHDGAVLYAHTKGASQPTEFNDRWRQSMQRHVVEGWQHCLEVLEGHDAVGCHWLHPDVYGGMGDTPFFGGNYWIATCDYLRTLPEIPAVDRWGAERWIGLGNPDVVDLLPGWPGDSVFEQGMAA